MPTFIMSVFHGTAGRSGVQFITGFCQLSLCLCSTAQQAAAQFITCFCQLSLCLCSMAQQAAAQFTSSPPLMLQVVCATCVGCGDNRLKGFRFQHVLIDEATQVNWPHGCTHGVHGVVMRLGWGDVRFHLWGFSYPFALSG